MTPDPHPPFDDRAVEAAARAVALVAEFEAVIRDDERQKVAQEFRVDVAAAEAMMAMAGLSPAGMTEEQHDSNQRAVLAEALRMGYDAATLHSVLRKLGWLQPHDVAAYCAALDRAEIHATISGALIHYEPVASRAAEMAHAVVLALGLFIPDTEEPT